MPKNSQKSKFYAVHTGRKRGVFTSWSECENQVKGYSGATYKSFNTKTEALAFLRSGFSSTKNPKVDGISGAGTRNSPNRSTGNNDISVKKNFSRSSNLTSLANADSVFSQHNKFTTDNDEENAHVVYTDGSSLGNGKYGARAGWGVYWGENDPRNDFGKVDSGEQTNNRGELMAIKRAVHTIAKEGTAGSKYEIRADSEYSRNALTKWANNWERNGWKTSSGQPVKNQDLIRETRDSIQALTARGIEVIIKYVEAHSGHAGNEAADMLAKRGADQ